MPWSTRHDRRIKLQDLRVLVAVADAGSMGRAAQRLGSSQPAVSRSVAELEHALGVTLFHRTPQGIEPTRAGRALLDASAAAMDSLRRGVQEIEALSEPESGELRIGGNESIIASLLPAILDRLRERFPRIAVQVALVAGRAQQCAELRDRRLDLVIGRIGPTPDGDIETEPLYEEATHVVASETNPWSRRKRPFSFVDLADEPWALPLPNTVVGAQFADAFRAAGVPYPPRCVVTGNIHIHCALVAGGAFLAIFPASMLRQNASRLGFRVLPVTSPVPPASIGILRLRHRAPTPVVEHFATCARLVGAQLTSTNG